MSAIGLGLLRQLFSFGHGLFDAANHIEGSLRQMVIFPVHDRLERADGVFDLDELARDSSEDFGDVERLAKKALDLAGAGDDQLIFFRQLIHAENGDDILQRLILLQRLLDGAGHFIMLLADDRRS